MSARRFLEGSELGRRIDGLRKELDAVRPLAPEVEHRVLQKLRLDWNYHSNAIEGNSLDYGETRAFLMHGITAKGKPLKDYLDIRGHNEAIDHLLAFARNKDEELREAEIRALHEMVLVEPYEVPAETIDGRQTTRRVSLGRYKSAVNWVRTETGEIHHYATPEETPARMQELMAWLREQRGEHHPVERAVLLHHRFVAIHPFDDGNGRMARLLMNLLLIQDGYPPAVIRQQDRGEYYAALARADGGDPLPLLELVGEALIHSMEVYLKASRGEPIEEPDDLDKELRLLEQDLESRAQKIDARLDEESRRHTEEHVVQPAWAAVTAAVSKFRRFFLSSEQGLVRRGKTVHYEDDHGGEIVTELPTLEYTEYAPDAMSEELRRQALDPTTRTLTAFVQLLDFRDRDNPFRVEVRLAVTYLDFSVLVAFWISPPCDLWGLDFDTPSLVTPNHRLELPYRRPLTELELRTLVEALERDLLSYIKRRDQNPGVGRLVLDAEEFRRLRAKYVESRGESSGFADAELLGIEDGRIVRVEVSFQRSAMAREPSEQRALLELLIRAKQLHFHPMLRISARPPTDDDAAPF